MSKDRREPEYPTELEAHFILRLPEEPAKQLREVLQSGENLKNRLTIQIGDDMRHGEVRFDHWLLHAKIVDLPTIVESLKTIDNKSFYKSADICQMMICKTEPEPFVEEESPVKNKKKDLYKVDKKFLWPHGITPPTKNVRKRRFRKTLRKKCAEAPEIEKEVKRLLRADNEAVNVTWEVIKEEDDLEKAEITTARTVSSKAEKKMKIEKSKWVQNNESSNVVDIFGGAVSDSEEEDNMNIEIGNSRLSAFDSHLSDTNSMQEAMISQSKEVNFMTEFESNMFENSQDGNLKFADRSKEATPSASTYSREKIPSKDESFEHYSHGMSENNIQQRIDQLRAELQEMRLRKQRTENEIAGMENLALRQRFHEILHTLNQDIMYKDMEYQGLLVMQNSEDI